MRRCRGDFGRLGHADCGDVFLPKPLAALDGQRIVACACGDTHTLCMAADGALWAFGRNSNGQLGNGGTEDGTVPRRVEAMQVTPATTLSPELLTPWKAWRRRGFLL